MQGWIIFRPTPEGKRSHPVADEADLRRRKCRIQKELRKVRAGVLGVGDRGEIAPADKAVTGPQNRNDQIDIGQPDVWDKVGYGSIKFLRNGAATTPAAPWAWEAATNACIASV